MLGAPLTSAILEDRGWDTKKASLFSLRPIGLKPQGKTVSKHSNHAIKSIIKWGNFYIISQPVPQSFTAYDSPEVKYIYCIKRVESRNSPQDQHTRRITNVWVICRRRQQQQQPKDVDRQQKSLYNFYRAELAPSGGILIDWLIDWQIILSWLL